VNAILARLGTLLTFVTTHSVPVDLRPETELVEAMTKFYYQGVNHLENALKAFIAADELWRQLHEE